MAFPHVERNEATFGKYTYSSTGVMAVPDDSPHVRSVEFRLPRFRDTPSVSVQIVASAGAIPLTVYALKINELGAETQIAVSAQTLDGGAAGGRYWCNIVAIATPAPA
jgi:hypothetical protein